MDAKEFNKLKGPGNSPKPVKNTTFIVFIVIIASVFLIYHWSDSKKDEVKEQTVEKPKEIDKTQLYYYSKVMAKDYVKQVLKSPSTADFPSEEFKVSIQPDSTVIVKCAVDAQNSYGAMIRGNYYLIMKWRKDYTDTDNWTLLKIENED